MHSLPAVVPSLIPWLYAAVRGSVHIGMESQGAWLLCDGAVFASTIFTSVGDQQYVKDYKTAHVISGSRL